MAPETVLTEEQKHYVPCNARVIYQLSSFIWQCSYDTDARNRQSQRDRKI